MNKTELTARIAKATNQTQATVAATLDATLDAITKTFAQGETVTLVGFGIFTPKHKNARAGRNPKTGAPALIPARNTVSFKLSKGLLEKLNP
ncbi:HU family DNA-binding protein [Acinetobacter proteolyticus]|uniref:DNA-binding protein HU n=1 Tax=Acinetobacter proteolyticus TaxID=1776741 RepID=A0A2N0WIA5_9GAMM|nr:HU family DNA-binding protein [Acinetobacter proteolyticus]PKF35532.1 DNA-binding protein HU [Acinetobacter proteolyticus]